MATLKQTKKVYKQIRYHLYHLQCALNRAHDLRVIRYEDYSEESPCKTLMQTKNRIKLTTEKALAEAMSEEIMKELKGVW